MERTQYVPSRAKLNFLLSPSFRLPLSRCLRESVILSRKKTNILLNWFISYLFVERLVIHLILFSISLRMLRKSFRYFFFNIKRMIKFISPHSFSLANSLLGPFVRSTYVPLIDTVDFWLHIVMMMTHFICTRGLKIEISLCEHIVDACARVVQQFKRLACPELQSITRIKQNICVFFILHVYECNAMNSKQNLHFQWMAIINLCLSWVVSVCVYTRLYVSHSLALFLSLTLTLTLTVNPHVFWTLMRSWIYWLDKSIKGVLWIDSFFWGAIKLLDWIIIYP